MSARLLTGEDILPTYMYLERLQSSASGLEMAVQIHANRVLLLYGHLHSRACACLPCIFGHAVFIEQFFRPEKIFVRFNFV